MTPLTDKEIVALTGRKQKSAQVRVLRTMAGQLAEIGLSFVVRPDGKPVVLRREPADRLNSNAEPDWSAL